MQDNHQMEAIVYLLTELIKNLTTSIHTCVCAHHFANGILDDHFKLAL